MDFDKAKRWTADKAVKTAERIDLEEIREKCLPLMKAIEKTDYVRAMKAQKAADLVEDEGI